MVVADLVHAAGEQVMNEAGESKGPHSSLWGPLLSCFVKFGPRARVDGGPWPTVDVATLRATPRVSG
jgi:hypothetical protein